MVRHRTFNWLVSDALRGIMRQWHHLWARITGCGFYCRALQGRSEYHITVRCDGTVACNSMDYDHAGQIGDLRRQEFDDIFFGPVAESFRRTLAGGRLPLRNCAACGELRRLPARDATPPPTVLPHLGMLVENTVRCNLDCRGCDRGTAAELRTPAVMGLETMAKVADLVQRLGIRRLSFHNLGEPFLSPTVAEELALLRGRLPDGEILVSTNGLPLSTDAKREAALLTDQIWFSLHGIDDRMVQRYTKQKQGGFERAYANMRQLAELRNRRGLAKPVLEWKYLLFNWNDRPDVLRRAIALATEAGIDAISFWPTRNPFYGVSWRYRLGLLNGIGRASWKGREAVLRELAPSLEPMPG